MKVTLNPEQELSLDNNDNETSCDNETFCDTETSCDSEFEPGDWTRRKENESIPITCQIPKNIYSGNVAVVASSSDISPAVLQKVVTSVVHKCGVDINKLQCSVSAASSQMKKANVLMSKQAKYDIKTAVQASKYPPIIHFDGKTV